MSSGKVGAFIVSRLSSSRLPSKALLEILGKPMIERLVERVKRAKTIDKVVIATSDEASDDPLEALAKRLGVGCHRGSLPNIMERVRGAAEAHGCDTIVEILGDNPLVHADLIDDVVRHYQGGRYDYAASLTKEYPSHAPGKTLFAVGIRVQAYTRAAAEKHREYPEYLGMEDKGSTAYIFDHPEKFKLGFVEAKGRWSALNTPDVNFAVNYRKNFDAVTRIFEALYPKDQNFSLEKAMAVYQKDKELHGMFGA